MSLFKVGSIQQLSRRCRRRDDATSNMHQVLILASTGSCGPQHQFYYSAWLRRRIYNNDIKRAGDTTLLGSTLRKMKFVLKLFILQGFAVCALQAHGKGTDQAVDLYHGDNPCDALKPYCNARGAGCDVEAEHPLLTAHFTNNVTNTLRQLGLQFDTTSLADCAQQLENYRRCKLVDNTRSRFIQELLLQLETVPQDDTEAMLAFEFARNEMKFTSEEKLELYSQAILLHPNSRLIVSQLGLAFLSLGFNQLAEQVFQNAVSRGLWPDVLQRPEWNYIPGLSAKPWHDSDDFAFIPKLEAGYEDIKEELLYNLRERSHVFAGEQENLNTFSGGGWTALQVKNGLGQDGYTQTALQYFPKTVQRLKDCEEDFLLVKFSAINPGTHIESHTGPSNERLRGHLALIHSGGARMRCGTEWRTWEEGKAFILDSSWEHEVVHEGKDLRVVLILDIWHPELPVKDRVE